MEIKAKRIRNLDRHLGWVEKGTPVTIGISVGTGDQERLEEVGFSPRLEVGESVLPARLGPVSRFNAEGGETVHKDQPKETAYRQTEWTWTEWHGRYGREEKSRVVDVPYERYPRTPIPPPGVELVLSENGAGQKVVVGPTHPFAPENEEEILHLINLFLELFGRAEILGAQLKGLKRVKLRRLNWDVLPPGRRPWEQLHSDLGPILDDQPEGVRKVVEFRFETINSAGPEFVAVGRAGFRGYVVFGFPKKGLYVLESTEYGNATYVFSDEWETLSQMSKAEILSEELQEDRLIHREGWFDKVKRLLT